MTKRGMLGRMPPPTAPTGPNRPSFANPPLHLHLKPTRFYMFYTAKKALFLIMVIRDRSESQSTQGFVFLFPDDPQ